MKYLEPVRLKEGFYADIEQQVLECLLEIIFKPLKEAIGESVMPELPNSKGSVLERAILSGEVQYADGSFTGTFNAKIGKELRGIGASFNKNKGNYTMPVKSVPYAIKAMAGVAKENARKLHQSACDALQSAYKNVDEAINTYKIDATIAVLGIEAELEKTFRKIEVPYNLSMQYQKELEKEYNKNMKLYISNFSKEEILTLRDLVTKNMKEGYRYSRLQKTIMARYGVTKNKAKFLARNETGILMAKYTKLRYIESGLSAYKWSTSHDVRVRPDHKRLDGRVFLFNDPPIVDTATGRRANAGEDYQCRCVSRPIFGKIDKSMIGKMYGG